MKVAHLITSFGDGATVGEGPGEELVDLTAVCTATGVEPVVVVLGSSGDGWNVTRLRRRDVPVVELGLAPWDPRAVPRTVAALREHDVDLLHTHRPWADVVGVAAARSASVPVVSTLYDVENLPTNPAERLKRTAAILARRRTIARTVAITHLQRERYRRFSGTDRGLVVVPSGVADPKPLTADERARVRRGRRIPDDGVLVVSAAPMRRGQGHDLLLDALTAVPAGLPLSVVLLGDGPLRPHLTARVENDDLLAGRAAVEARPVHDVARDVIGAADLFAYTPSAAALPLSLLRAAGLGVPAVAAHVGGIPELVKRDTGVLVPLDPHAVADALVRLAGDPGLRERLADGARRTFLANFEARGWAVRLRQVYDDAVARIPAQPVDRAVGTGPVTLPPGAVDLAHVRGYGDV